MAQQSKAESQDSTSKSKSGGDEPQASGLAGLASELPLDRLMSEFSGFGQALTQKGLSAASGGVGSLTGRLTDIAEGTAKGKAAKNMVKGDSPAKAGLKGVASKVTDQVKGAFSNLTGGGGGASNSKLKVTNILETVDVPVNAQVAYDQWTQFEDFPKFMKKVESVSQEEDEKLAWKAQIFWSHRSWTATITDQVPGERIVWKSQGQKGHVDGAITFHELAPNLTRILMVLEYHPKGLFEHTGNLWRAQGRRARLELKHFARHVSTQTLLHQDELEGWPGEIHDGKVVEKDASGGSGQDSRKSNGSSGSSRKSNGSSGSSRKSNGSSGSSRKSSSSQGSSRGGSSQGSSRSSGSGSSGSSSGRSSSSGGGSGSPRKSGSSRGGDSSGRPAKKAQSGQARSAGSRPAKKTAAASATSKRTTARPAQKRTSGGGTKTASPRSAKKTTKRGG